MEWKNSGSAELRVRAMLWVGCGTHERSAKAVLEAANFVRGRDAERETPRRDAALAAVARLPWTISLH